MKTFVILLIASMCLIPCIYSQRVHFGIRGGLTLSAAKLVFADNSPSDAGWRQSFMLGVLVDVVFNDRLSLRPELNLVGKGGQQGNTTGSGIYYYDEEQFYIDIPLNLIYKFPVKKSKFLLGAGPVMGFRTSRYSYFLPTKRSDFGVNILTGYEFPIGVSFNINYTHGLTNISDDQSFLSSYKNRCAGLTVCYLF